MGLMTTAAVLGAGSWGTAFAKIMADAGAEVTIWARRPHIATALTTQHRNPSYLSDIRLPPLRATTDPAQAMAGAEVVAFAVPAQSLRENLIRFTPHLPGEATLLSLVKGIENGTLLRMSQVIAQVTGFPQDRIAVLSGPNLAPEIAEGQPSATVIGCRDPQTGSQLQQQCLTSYFRPYTNTDVIGCEIGGACKNVIALACGIASGMGLGANSVSSLLTRGLAEITRLGIALGAEPGTLSGLAGVGDLVATCTSPLSRNRSFGEVLGAGGAMAAAQQATQGQVAEGVKSCISVRALAAAWGVEMPLSEAVYQVCHEGVSVAVAMDALLERRVKAE